MFFFYEDSDIWYKCNDLVIWSAVQTVKRENKVTQYMIVTAEDVKMPYDRIQET